MAEVRESSGLTTLAALREQETTRARAEAEQRARLESERELARLERERQHIERATAESLDMQRQAELSRLEAARVSELQRAEREARARQELQAQLAEERGARRSAELALTAQVLRQRLLAVLSAALCGASWLCGGVLYFGSLRPQSERAALATERSLADERQALAAAEQGSARSARRSEELAARVSMLELELRDQAAAVTPHIVLGVPQKPGQKLTHGVSASQPPCRDDGDPLNPCLKH